ncbi:MAG: dienelactone hydrolase family protein [Alphaproteobacteria bacterium]
MSEKISLSADGHRFDAWRADPVGPAKGGIVLLHAIYGLTSHMRDVCAMFADGGCSAIAPALYDRIGPDIVHSYDQTGAAAGRASYGQLAEDGILADVSACIAALRPSGRVAVSGFCTGGTWAWRSAAALEVDAAVIFYGSHVAQNLERTPRCPTVLHYGDSDLIVPMQDVDKIRAAHPNLPLHIYPGGGHAFFNPEQANYDAEAARGALEKSLEFLAENFS